jgi:glycosyltransferase involved in cell wall biosynthesis
VLRLVVVTNMYPTAADPTQGTFVEQQVKGLRDAGVDLHVVHLDRRGSGMRVYRKIRARVEEAIHEYQPDLVHCMYGGILAGITTRTCSKKPVVVSYCGSDLLGEGGVGSLLRRVVGAYRIRASHRAAQRASAVIVKSAGLAKALPASVNQRNVFVLPNGIDMERFRPLDRQECRARVGWREDRFHVLFTNGNGDPRKRIELARAAIEALRHRGVTAELNPIPRVPHSEVPIWMNAADAVILTSIHEGSPNAIKEALACNRPVVSVDVGDVRERLDGIAGCYLVDASPDAIAEGLYSVYTGPRTVMSRPLMRDLSLEAVTAKLIRIYHSVLTRSAKRINEGDRHSRAETRKSECLMPRANAR